MFPIPMLSILVNSTILATGLTTSSIGLAIQGGTKQLEYTVEPEGGALFDIMYTTTDATKMTIDSTGLMTFVAEGGFDAGMSAKNSQGTTLSDSSGGYVSVLGMYTDSLAAMDVGTTQQLVATISPTGADALPDMVIEYTTTDATVATVDSTGLITAIADGDCRIGCTATYQGTVTASDSSYLAVNAVSAGKPPPYEGTDWEMEVGPGWLYLSTGLSTIPYSVDWGDGTTATHTASQGVLRHQYTGTGNWTCKVSILESDLKPTQHCIQGDALLSVTKWPTKVITGVAFQATGGCPKLTSVPDTLPATWTTLSNMFKDSTTFNQDITGWDTSNIKDMSYMFYAANAFNQPIGNWNVSNVTSMQAMFNSNKGFNQPLANWDVSKVTTMQAMFSLNGAFNQPIGNWNTASLSEVRSMFYNNKIFTQDISKWNTSKITSMYRQNFDYGTSSSWLASNKPVWVA